MRDRSDTAGSTDVHGAGITVIIAPKTLSSFVITSTTRT